MCVLMPLVACLLLTRLKQMSWDVMQLLMRERRDKEIYQQLQLHVSELGGPQTKQPTSESTTQSALREEASEMMQQPQQGQVMGAQI